MTTPFTSHLNNKVDPLTLCTRLRAVGDSLAEEAADAIESMAALFLTHELVGRPRFISQVMEAEDLTTLRRSLHMEALSYAMLRLSEPDLYEHSASAIDTSLTRWQYVHRAAQLLSLDNDTLKEVAKASGKDKKDD